MNLKEFRGTIKLSNAHPDLIQAVQKQLDKIGLYQGIVDGKAGSETLASFAKFKKLEYLGHPDLLGETTAKALLEATETHPIPRDVYTPEVGTKVTYIVGQGKVFASEPIYSGCYFTWGEATKDLTRLPENSKVTDEIIILAIWLNKAREILGNRKIIINSWYRPPAINRACGGVSNSRHLLGDAADIVVFGMKPHDVYRQLDKWHGAKGGLGDSNAFTHIDLRGYRARFSYG